MSTDNISKSEGNQAFLAGQTIFREGDAAEFLYLVAEGQVEILLNGHRLETLGPGDILGEMALIDERPRSATAVARTDCLLTPISRPHFLALIQRTPLFAIQVMRVLVNRLRRTNLQMYS